MTDARIFDLSTHRARVGDVRVRLTSPDGPPTAVRVTLGGLRVQVSPFPPKWTWTIVWPGVAGVAAWIHRKGERQ